MANPLNKVIIFVGGIVYRSDGKILLAQRAYNEGHLPGYWAIPGGKLDFENDKWSILQDTIHRELAEEVGVYVEKEMHILTNNAFKRTDGEQVVAINFICKWRAGDAQPLEGTENIKWVTKKDINTLKIEENCKKQIEIAYDYIKNSP